MQAVDIVIDASTSDTLRARQIRAIYDFPERKESLVWKFEIDLSHSWNVGLIVGPSGSGKTTIMKELFGDSTKTIWDDRSVIDSFSDALSLEEVIDALGAVGLNSIPAWLRPYRSLSNGEQFRADLAQAMLLNDLIVFDEFSSVVDRDVGKIASCAAQKYVRRNGKRLVAVSCHYDIIDWLQPDWVIDAGECSFRRRELRQRPSIGIKIGRVSNTEWARFSRHHYMSADLHRDSVCFGAEHRGEIIGFCAVMYFPHNRRKNIYRVHRTVTLPDYQGIGVNRALIDTVGSAMRAVGREFRTFSAHPGYSRALKRNRNWAIVSAPAIKSAQSISSTVARGNFGRRWRATFQYVGTSMDRTAAQKFLGICYEKADRKT